jgi:adenosine deaminase CECR1
MTARYPQVRISLHAGESAARDSHVVESIGLGATRIGHGINAALDPAAMDLLRTGRYLVEICLLSNRALGYVPDLRLHPFPTYLRQGVPVSLNTDDRGTLGSNLTDEYFLAVSLFDLSWSEVVRIGRSSLEYSFAEPELKAKMLSRYDENIRAFEKKYSSPDWRPALAAVRLPGGHALPRF